MDDDQQFADFGLRSDSDVLQLLSRGAGAQRVDDARVRQRRLLRCFHCRPLSLLLQHPDASVLLLLLCLFLLSLFGFVNLGYELFPKTDVGQMEILVRKESGTPLRTTEKTIAKMEGILKEVMGEDLSQTVSNIGVFYDFEWDSTNKNIKFYQCPGNVQGSFSTTR